MSGTHHPSYIPVHPDEPDHEGQYQHAIPRQWPEGLRFPGTAIDLHRQAMGIALGWVASAMWVVTRTYFPQRDTAIGAMLWLWEALFDLEPTGSYDARAARIIARMRARGTGTRSRVISIVSAAFGEPGGHASIGFLAPDLATVIADDPPAGDPGWKDAMTGHFHSEGALTLDRGLADDVLRRITPGWCRWQAGDDKWLLEGMNINEGVVQ